MHFELFQAIFDHVFCTLRGGLVYFFLFIFHTLGGGGSECMELSIFLNSSLRL